jgi:hypothetical protein
MSIILVDTLGNVPWRHCAFLFIAMVFVFSDFFIAHVLAMFENSVYMNSATTRGTFIQILVVILFFILIDALIKNEIV